jgi:TolB-like protein/DNA-binding winged helix-turn-helix (wHTH) protein
MLYFTANGACLVAAGRIKFDDFELDCDRYELLRAGRGLKLEKIPMELLILLVAKNGHLVTRQEIVERLWGSDVFVDTEHGINTAVRKIRQILRDDPEQPRFVQTVTGKGYRFIAVTTAGENGSGSPASATVVSFPDVATVGAGLDRSASPSSASTPPRSWAVSLRSAAVGAAILISLALLIAWAIGWRHQSFARASSAQILSVAVLPLDNLSGDHGQDFFADGMTDELITMLAKNTSLRVVSRTSVMQYKGVHRPLREIAQELGVDGIVEGSVERSAGKVHMTVQLIQAGTDAHIWAESYERSANEAASLPREMALTIAQRVNSQVKPTGPQRYVNADAHDAYLWGRYYWYAGNSRKSAEYFQKAIDLQPDYAAAWSGLSDSYNGSAVMGEVRPEEIVDRAELAAKKAVALDDGLAEAHNSMAAIYLFQRWDFEQADRESARAIQLDPNFAEGHHLRSYVLLALNRTSEAVQEQKKSMELDPLIRVDGLCYVQLLAHQFDAAVNDARQRLDARPADPDLLAMLAEAYRLKGMETESARETEKMLESAGKEADAAAVRRAFQHGGLKAVLELQLEDLGRKSRKEYISPWKLAVAYAEVGVKEGTIRYLEEAYRQHSPRLVFLQQHPDFDFLHSEPRYQALVKAMGLPPAF